MTAASIVRELRRTLAHNNARYDEAIDGASHSHVCLTTRTQLMLTLLSALPLLITALAITVSGGPLCRQCHAGLD
jgi:hypothetical protein